LSTGRDFFGTSEENYSIANSGYPGQPRVAGQAAAAAA